MSLRSKISWTWIILGIIPAGLHAQGRFNRVDLETSTPVNVISDQDLRQVTIRVGELQEMLTYTPGNVLVERKSTLNTPGINRDRMVINLRGTGVPAMNSNVGYAGINPIPAFSIDKIEVLKEGTSAVYGSDAIAGVVNFVLTSSDKGNGSQNMRMEPWQEYVRDIFSKPNSSITTDDNTYGGKVSINILPVDNYFIENRVYLDLSGRTRLNINRQFDQMGSMYEELDYFDCSGKQLFKDINLTDPYGNGFDLYNVIYTNGIAAMGYRDIAPGNEFIKYRQPYNITTGTIDFNIRPGTWNNYLFTPPVCNQEKNNEPGTGADEDLAVAGLLFFGLSYLMEDTDGINPFCMFGPGLNYTHMLNRKLGVGLDAAYYTGERYGWDQSRLNIMAGIEYYPFNTMGITNPFSLAPFIYLGLSRHVEKYMNYKNSLASFSTLIGLNAAYILSQRIRIKASGAANPVFGENNTAINGRLDLGVRYRF